MYFKDNDLKQLNDDYLKSLDHDQVTQTAINLLQDLKITRERLNQNSTNSSRPPSSGVPWESSTGHTPADEDLDAEVEQLPECDQEKEAEEKPSSSNDKSDKEGTEDSSVKKRLPGRQPGSKGYGRTQKLPVDSTVTHRAETCKGCGGHLGESASFIGTTGHYIIDIVVPSDGQRGLIAIQTKHVYGETTCPCGYKTGTLPYTSEFDDNWNVKLTEWRLVGPRLVSLICFLAMRMRLSRSKIREFLFEWLGLSLSVGTINQCIHEAGRSVEPLEEELLDELRNSSLKHADETSWLEHSKKRWLWVFLSSMTVLYVIGSRSAKVVKAVLGDTVFGWLMTDGYSSYRQYENRLRCWAHLIRKAKGLSESLDESASDFGKKTLGIFEKLMESIYRAREGPELEDLFILNKNLLTELFNLCQDFQNYSHSKASALAFEILNDWEAIFRVLDHPELPLTNNEAERLLRHWVIARRISYGTRNNQGSRAFTLLASVIETCRRRGIPTWLYLANVIEKRRKGETAPSLSEQEQSPQKQAA